MRVGVIGLGRMGRAILARLAGCGVEVAGWNRSLLPHDADQGVAGLRRAADLGQLVEDSDIIVLSLFDDAAVAAVMTRLLALDLAGRLIADTSTVRPDTLAAFADRAASAGAALVDAPISGGPEMVAAGTAGIFMGGTAPDIARFAPLASHLSRSARHIGALGSGATAKIVNNMLLMGCWEALNEAVGVGARAGLDLATMVGFLFEGPAANPMMTARRDLILGESERIGFPVAGVLKDAALFRAVAGALCQDVPAIDAAEHRFREAAEAGCAAQDVAITVRRAAQP